MRTAADVLDKLTINGQLYKTLPEDAVRCSACAHYCLIRKGRRGICKVRFNQDGKLRVPWGYVAGLQADPIEKKPFYHVLPGTIALTFGMLGCDFHCAYCQNWLSSQTLRDPISDQSVLHIRKITPDQVVDTAESMAAEMIVSSYNEPLITTEWAVAIFKIAKEIGIRTAYVSNGNASTEVLAFLRPHLDAYKIDLKTMQDKNYRLLGGVLKNVLDTIQHAWEIGLWVEVVTLVVPGFNDSNDELWDTARFLTGISADIPWHVSAFHKDYKMTLPDNTPAETLIRAADIGREAGLRYVYAGNLPGRVNDYEDTICTNCGTSLIHRRGYGILKYSITSQGTCPTCSTRIAGIWSDDPQRIKTHGLGLPRLV
jgi:pyruvate formate lyase activating enzyme